MEDFSAYMTSERQRINAEIDRLNGNIAEYMHQRGTLERELVAIDAYEAAKNGKTVASKANGARRARKGSRREEITSIVRETGGLTRGELIERLGVKGDKSGEMSISNALTALTKANQLARENGKYVYQAAA